IGQSSRRTQAQVTDREPEFGNVGNEPADSTSAPTTGNYGSLQSKEAKEFKAVPASRGRTPRFACSTTSRSRARSARTTATRRAVHQYRPQAIGAGMKMCEAKGRLAS